MATCNCKTFTEERDGPYGTPVTVSENCRKCNGGETDQEYFLRKRQEELDFLYPMGETT